MYIVALYKIAITFETEIWVQANDTEQQLKMYTALVQKCILQFLKEQLKCMQRRWSKMDATFVKCANNNSSKYNEKQYEIHATVCSKCKTIVPNNTERIFM